MRFVCSGFLSVTVDEFVLTDGTLYASCDGQLLPGYKKVTRIGQVVKFVNDRK